MRQCIDDSSYLAYVHGFNAGLIMALAAVVGWFWDVNTIVLLSCEVSREPQPVQVAVFMMF